MKVRIENKSSAAITVKGRNTLRIPAQGILETVLPDVPQTHKIINRLRREYPALTINIEKEHENSAAEKQTNETRQEEIPQPATPMDKDSFVSLAKAVKGNGDKWNVNVDGLKAIKVREAADEAAAIELAYAAYLESFSASVKE